MGPQIFRTTSALGHAESAGYGPRIVGNNATDWLPPPGFDREARERLARLEERLRPADDLRPLVLKCPNCIAPLAEKGGRHGDMTHCGYCKVPLVWEPSISMSRDDFRMPSHALAPITPATEPGMIVRGIGPLELHAMCSFDHELYVREVFRPRYLWINPNCADHVVVDDVRIGHHSTIRRYDSDGPIAGRLCAEGLGLDLFAGETLTPGLRFVITFKNITGMKVSLLGALRGTEAPRGSGPHVGALNAGGYPWTT